MQERKKQKMNENLCKLVFAICILVLVIMIICVSHSYKKWKDKTRIEVSPDTNEKFVVQNNKNEPEWVGREVARRLSQLAKKADTLIQYMVTNSQPTAEIARRLATRWASIRHKNGGLRETGLGESTAAYTVNKGEELRICIRDPHSETLFEDPNTSMLVLLHELAHLMSITYGHNYEFKKNFAFITKLAVDLGLYHYVDYSKHPTSYCNVDITHAPF